MFDHPPKYALVSLLVAFVGLARCAGSQNATPMMPGGTTPGTTAAHRNRPAASSSGYSLTDLCPLVKNAACEVGMEGTFFLFDFGGALNDADQAAGTSTTSSEGTEPTATLFENGKLKNLNTLGALTSEGMAINASGQVAGFESSGSTDFGSAFLYSNGKMMSIENSTLFPRGSQAYGINKSAQVVGIGFLESSYHAFLYSGGKMVDLDPFGASQSWATSINDSGEIIGTAYGVPGGATVTTWLYKNGKITNLSETNTGMFIGYAYDRPRNKKCPSCGPTNDDIGLIFTSSGPVALNTLIPPGSGFTITDAIAINDSGQIVADAKTSSGVFHAVLLTPK
jgi:probable HAF family extracellular repeat protein